MCKPVIEFTMAMTTQELEVDASLLCIRTSYLLSGTHVADAVAP